MSENIIKVGNSTIIINGGDPLPGCPSDWDEAKLIEERLNEGKEGGPQWDFDCGFKLDYDGPIIHVGSRFYPPKTSYGSTWDGTVSIYLFDEAIAEKKFDCPTLDQLKTEVEAYVNGFRDKLKQLLSNA